MSTPINIYQVFTRLFVNPNETNAPFGRIEENGCTKFNDISTHILSTLKKFDELSTNGMIENPDLNNHKNFSSVKQSIQEGSLSKSIGKAKKEIKILYEDDKYMLFLPLSFDAASVYGRGTKWCITQSEYFYRYTDKGILAYFIEKGINRKIALYYDMDISYYFSVLNLEKSKFHYDNILKSNVSDPYEKDVKYDAELMEIYNFSNKFSCWTDWDSRMEMMFIPIPLTIKEIFINYCKENNIQNASLLDKVETDNIIKYYENNEESNQEVPQPQLVEYDGELSEF
jgi:hypothetical protein